nr:hypothetical protein Iba_chr02dCG4000 [Ipomoea batatas]
MSMHHRNRHGPLVSIFTTATNAASTVTTPMIQIWNRCRLKLVHRWPLLTFHASGLRFRASLYLGTTNCLQMLIFICLRLGLSQNGKIVSVPIEASGLSAAAGRQLYLETLWLETLMALIREQFDEATQVNIYYATDLFMMPKKKKN